MDSKAAEAQRAAAEGAAGPIATEVTIVIPTFNERENVAEVIRRTDAALSGVKWELQFVDDHSPDETAEYVRGIARSDPRVRCIERIGRRGLSSACIEGIMASSSPYVAVMDADLQHDVAILPLMLASLRSDECDLAIGTRYAEGGSVGQWNELRLRVSRISTTLSQLLLPVAISDPMSGYFMIRAASARAAINKGVSGVGFKVLLDLLTSAPSKLRVKEIPYEFQARVAGESKLGALVAWEFLMMILYKLLGGAIPIRFLSFVLVGGSGVFVHFSTFILVRAATDISFILCQSIATATAMVTNFTVNNLLTYRDMSLHGWRWWRGLLTFSVACGLGAVGNVGVANFLFNSGTYWSLAAGVGVVVGVVWNFAVTQSYTWGRS